MTYTNNSGLPQLANRYRFLVVFAETATPNNLNKCLNWFRSSDNRGGRGEAASTRQMAAHTASAYGADARRTYVTGLSAGDAMTSVMSPRTRPSSSPGDHRRAPLRLRHRRRHRVLLP
ncbi:PHB depolymerase family esterase [Streptomyces viridiviolaceus]